MSTTNKLNLIRFIENNYKNCTIHFLGFKLAFYLYDKSKISQHPVYSLFNNYNFIEKVEKVLEFIYDKPNVPNIWKSYKIYYYRPSDVLNENNSRNKKILEKWTVCSLTLILSKLIDLLNNKIQDYPNVDGTKFYSECKPKTLCYKEGIHNNILVYEIFKEFVCLCHKILDSGYVCNCKFDNITDICSQYNIRGKFDFVKDQLKNIVITYEHNFLEDLHHIFSECAKNIKHKKSTIIYVNLYEQSETFIRKFIQIYLINNSKRSIYVKSLDDKCELVEYHHQTEFYLLSHEIPPTIYEIEIPEKCIMCDDYNYIYDIDNNKIKKNRLDYINKICNKCNSNIFNYIMRTNNIYIFGDSCKIDKLNIFNKFRHHNSVIFCCSWLYDKNSTCKIIPYDIVKYILCLYYNRIKNITYKFDFRQRVTHANIYQQIGRTTGLHDFGNRIISYNFCGSNG